MVIAGPHHVPARTTDTIGAGRYPGGLWETFSSTSRDEWLSTRSGFGPSKFSLLSDDSRATRPPGLIPCFLPFLHCPPPIQPQPSSSSRYRVQPEAWSRESIAMPQARSRPPSPSGTPRMRQGHADDSTTITSLTALPGFIQSPTPIPTAESWDPLDMLSRDKERLQPTFEIIVTNDVLCLQGPGAEAEPVLLSGNVVLNLPENADIKDITLQFRGKARFASSNDS